MNRDREISQILHECFFAFGQAIGTTKAVDADALMWLRDRYRQKFRTAICENGNSWDDDRDRVTAVGRYLGSRAAFHAGDRSSIDRAAAIRAAAEIEAGCRMSRERSDADDLAARERWPIDAALVANRACTDRVVPTF